MKKLILILTMLCASLTFGQSEPLLWAWGDLEGNLRDLNNKWFNTSDDKTLFVLGGKTTLTQTGAQVQTILDGTLGAISITTSLTVTDDDWIGLGSAKGRLVFDDLTQDIVYIRNAWLSIEFTNATVYDGTLTTGQILEGTLLVDNPSNGSGTFSQIVFESRASSSIGRSRIVSVNDGTNATYLTFVTEDAGGMSEKMRIAGGGLITINETLMAASDGQADDDYEISLPGITALVHGMMVTFQANTANTDGATLEITEEGSTPPILKMHDQELASGDIEQYQWVTVVFDTVGTDNWQMTSQLAQ